MVSALTYVTLAIVIPSIAGDNLLLKEFSTASSLVAPFLAFILLLPAPFSALYSAFNSRRKRHLFDDHQSIHSIRSLDWRNFEELVAEAYRRKGFKVTENRGAGSDGGIDIRLEKNGNVHLVQCKQWRSQKVGVKVVREMYGIMTAENASSVIIITSGAFTREALSFASNKRIDLVGGSQLEALLSQVQSPQIDERIDLVGVSDQCPNCGSKLVLKTAKRGARKGSKFFGCSSFPKCRYTQANSS